MSGEVIIVGGGIIGLASAWRCLQAGLTVTVFDPDPTRAAAFAAAGMLTPVTEAYWGEEDLIAVSTASMRRYAGFVAELEAVTGLDVDLRTSGVLVVAFDNDDLEVIEDLFRLHESCGLPSRRLRGRECRAVEPLLTPTTRGGVLAPDDGSVNPRRVLGALSRAVELSGGSLVCQQVRELRIQGDRVEGVLTDDGVAHGADVVVLTAGAWTPLVRGVPEADRPPVRPVKGQILRMTSRLHSHHPGITVRGFVRGSHVYIVPRSDSEVVIGATSEERGFSRQVTGWGVNELLRDALTLIPGLGESELTECRAGLRPGTPDNGPVVGWGRTEGLYLATGHFRHGVLLAPITAEAVAADLAGRPAPAEIGAFRPGRFVGEFVP
ncbi:MAG: Hydrogen cyanide synthase subunit HcnC [Acidimicrobiales bacterium]|nr:Hydrogen cyanide synthase subunit HcnC [Acidimicrobiales bacterium]